MIRALLFVVLLLPALTNAQNKIVFKDNFTNNKHKWQLLKDSNFNVNIKSGVLHIEKFRLNKISNGCLWLRKEITDFKTSSDFEITFFARVLNYGEGRSSIIDFQWGHMNETGDCKYYPCDSLHQINIRANGSVRMEYFRKGWHNYVPWSDTITAKKPVYRKRSKKKSRFIKYEIIQKAQVVYLKRDGETIFSQKIKPIAGNSIGIQQCAKCSWQIKKLIIKQQQPHFNAAP